MKHRYGAILQKEITELERFYTNTNNSRNNYTNYADNSLSNYADSCNITNTATAKGYYPFGDTGIPQAVTGEDTVSLGCILADIVKTASLSSANPGDTIQYTITFKNMSARDMYNVKITDQLSPYLEVIATSIMPRPQMGETLANGISIGRVPALSEKTLTFSATVTNDVSEDIVNRAFADFNFRDASGAEQSASTPITSHTTTVETSGITVTKTADKSYVTANGEQVQFTVTVKNNTGRPISDLVVTDNLPSSLEYVEKTTSINGERPIDADPTGGIYVGTLAGGASATVSFAAKVNLQNN